MLDRDDVRRAQHPEQQRAAVGMVQPVADQRRRHRRVERQAQLLPGHVRGGHGELMKGHRVDLLRVRPNSVAARHTR